MIESISWENFGSWKSGSLDLSKRGLVLIRGRTGSGKSTVFRALFWGLYGYAPEGSAASEVVNEKVQRDTCVKVFLSWDNKRYEIRRYRNHYLYQNKAFIFIDGNQWNEADAHTAAIDKEIARIIPETIMRTIFFVQRDYKSRWPSLTDAQQKKLLEEITELSILPKAEKIAKENMKKNNDLLINVNSELQVLINELDNHKIELKRAKKKESIDRKALKRELKDVRKLLVSRKNLISENQDKVNRYTPEYKKALDVVRSIDKQMSQTRYAERANKDKIQKLRSMPDICPVCGTKVNKSHIESEIQTVQRDINACLKILEKCQTEYDKAQKRSDEIGKKLESSVDSVNGYKDAVRTLISREIMIKERMKLTKTNTKVHREAIHNLRKKIEVRKRRRSLISRWKLQAEFWVRGFGHRGLRALIMPAVLSELEKRTNSYLSVIDPMIQATFGLSSSSRIEQAYRRGKKWRSYASFSGGQKQAIDLCVGLALRDLAESSLPRFCDLIILDEAFEGLDSGLIQRIPNLLKLLNKDSVFIISHNERIEPYFRTILTVREKDGFSEWG